MTIYQKNVKALSIHHPELVELLNGEISVTHIQVLRAKSGARRLMVRGESGAAVAIHNESDPEGVAQRTAKKISHRQGVLVLLGMGLGYLAKLLGQRVNEELALLVYEADPGIFKTAMEHVDLTKLLNSSMVKILVGSEANVGSWCYSYMLKTFGHVHVISYEPAFRAAPTVYHQKRDKELLPYTQSNLINHATANHLGPLFVRGMLEAIPHVVRVPGVNRLRNLFAGKPAILIAAGPSLGKNVHYLKSAKGRAVLISADTVLGYLLARGIIPDFVVSVDPQDETYTKYHGVDIPSDVALVFHPSCNAEIVKHFPGPKYVSASSMGIYQWLQNFWPEKGSMEQDVQCQVHLGFNLAQWLGCDPIIIVGHDLCYTDDLMHVKGGSYLTREEEDRHVAEGVNTRNIFGQIVGTYPVFLGYKATMERKIEAFPGRVVNATEGGVNLQGAENLLFQDAFAECWAGEVIDVGQSLRKVNQSCVESPDWEGLLQELRDRARDYFRLERVSKRLCSLMDKIEKHVEGTQEIDHNLSKLTNQAERLTKQVPRYGTALGLLQLIDFRLEEYMWKEKTDAIDSIEDPLDRLRKQLDRGRRFYGDVMKAIAFFRPDLKRLEERLECQWKQELRNEPGLAIASRLDRTEELISIGLFDAASQLISPLLESERQASTEPRLALLSLRVPLTLNQIGLAWKRSQEFRTLLSVTSEGKDLMAQAKTLWVTWQKKQQEVNILGSLSSSPTMESGNFYFRIGNHTRAAQHYKNFSESSNIDDTVRGEALYRLSKAYQALGDMMASVEALEGAMLASPADPRVYYDLGVLSLKEQRVEVAEQFFEKGAEVALEDPAFCEAVGAVFAAAGAHEQAIQFFERALMQCPQDPDLIKKIAQSYQTLFQPMHLV